MLVFKLTMQKEGKKWYSNCLMWRLFLGLFIFNSFISFIDSSRLKQSTLHTISRITIFHMNALFVHFYQLHNLFEGKYDFYTINFWCILNNMAGTKMVEIYIWNYEWNINIRIKRLLASKMYTNKSNLFLSKCYKKVEVKSKQ